MTPSPRDIARPVERATNGDRKLRGQLLEQDRGRLRKLVALRLDHRLQGRVDPSDVIQEASLDASRRLHDYARSRSRCRSTPGSGS